MEETKTNILTTTEEFKNEMKNLVKVNAEAKDNVKFLSTLQNKLRNLQENELPKIKQTLPSLLSGLKLGKKKIINNK